MQRVLTNKNQNDPQKKLKSFKFKVYNRLVITANPDSINGTLDSIFVTQRGIRKFIEIDSTDYNFKKSLVNNTFIKLKKFQKYSLMVFILKKQLKLLKWQVLKTHL